MRPFVPPISLHFLVSHLPEAVDDVVPDGRLVLEVQPGGRDEGDSLFSALRGAPEAGDEVVRFFGPPAVNEC